MATEEESIEQAAASRRERLKALKAAQELLNAPDEDSSQAAENQTDDTNEEKCKGGTVGKWGQEKPRFHLFGLSEKDCTALVRVRIGKEWRDYNLFFPLQLYPFSSHACNPSMKFRNYVPHDKQLQEGKVAPPVLPKFEDPVAAEPPASEEKEDPFVNIAPKKPNWDLRRDVQKKLDKLERRTQKAIFKLMEQQEQEKQLDEGGNAIEE
ncbi:coiled-coil domain-containing protein 12 [Gossypium australe]|uniref:Coiled-coil domain-containing protein 12 n=2 Tax=Gossypium TaxID=3633 RepID=A0A5B6U6C7_9ROSI|nr:coiled-coil domain-containing protein 12 [Gossypium australe]